VAATRGVIGFRGVRRAHLVALLDEIDNLVVVVHELFLEACDLDHIVLVFSDGELLVFIEQVVELAAIDFVHRNGDSEVPLVVFPVVDASLEQVFNSYTLQSIHRVRLARASLPVSEDSNDALVEDQV